MRAVFAGTSVVAVAGLLAAASFSQAAAKTWSGATADWSTANWTPSGTPVLSNATSAGTNDTATIGSGTVTYVPGGDFTNNSTLTINGTGIWQQQATNISWIKFGNGAGNTGILNVNGGKFDTADAGNFFVGNGGTGNVNVGGGQLVTKSLVISGASSFVKVTSGSVTATAIDFQGGTIDVSGGTFQRTVNGLDIAAGRSLLISGSGTVTVAGEFKPKAVNTVSMTGGTLNATLISFDGAVATLNFGGGTINLSGSGFQGIFAAGADRYVDFTGSSGTINLAAVTTANANLLLTSDRIRRNGLTADSYFQVSSDGGSGSIITLVPEPGSLALIGLGGLLSLRRRRR